MSVRAHAVKKVEYYPNSEVFNLWHDELLMGLIGEEIYERLNSDGCGMTELSVEDIETALECLKVRKATKKDIEYTREILKKLRKYAEENDGYILLDCF